MITGMRWMAGLLAGLLVSGTAWADLEYATTTYSPDYPHITTPDATGYFPTIDQACRAAIATNTPFLSSGATLGDTSPPASLNNTSRKWFWDLGQYGYGVNTGCVAYGPWCYYFSSSDCNANPPPSGFTNTYFIGWEASVVSREAQSAVITLHGPSTTKALVAGPVLPQTAHVSQNGSPAPGKSVTVAVVSGVSLSGTTDANGDFAFTYVPPHQKTIDQLTGNCTGCSNVAQKAITVDACDVCGAVGNPISAATGEKLQSEADWQDSAPHPLSLTRTYRSYDNIAAGLGPKWSHHFAAEASRSDAEGVVRLGDGGASQFRRDGSAWTAINGRDTLLDTPVGLAYTAASDESRWQFDLNGRLLSITQRNGWSMAMAYNAAGQLASVTNAFGRSLQFIYDATGRLASATTPDNRQVAYFYDSTGRLGTVRLPDNSTRSYQYENAAYPLALTGITNEAGVRYATFSYDSAGRATRTEHAGGALGYNVDYGSQAAPPVGSLVAGSAVDPSIYQSTAQVTDPLGTPQTYTWQGGDGQVRLLNASGAFDGGQVASRSLGALYLPVSETDFLGVQTMYTWDLSRQLKLSTTKASGLPEAQTLGTQWHPNFRLPVLVTEAGRSTAYSYDAVGNKLSQTVTDPAANVSRTWQWTYTAQGLVATMTDPKGATWTYGYDSAGNRTSEINPLGQRTSYGYDAAGRVTTQTEPNGLATTYSYDARGRVTGQVRGGEASSFSYTATGDLATALLPNSYQVNYAYDAAQRLVGAVDNRGATIVYTLDGSGNRVHEEVRDGSGAIALATSRVINSLNKVAALQGAAGQTTALVYDANGEPVAQTDPLNQPTRQVLDGLRRPVTTVFADNATATQAWNQLDQLTRVTDPKGVASSYQTNAFGEVVAEASPDIGSMAYQRNAAGEVTGITDAVGNSTTLQRDALGRPTGVQYSPDNVVAFSYDQGQTGYLSRIADQSGGTAYERDPQGRVLSKIQAVNDIPSSPSQFKVQYGYTAGELTSVTYPSGLKVFYSRTAGRITSVSTQEPSTNVFRPKPVLPFVTNLAYTALGQPKAWSWSSGDSAARNFDADGRMTATEFSSYSYDAASRITGIGQNLWASSTTTQVVGTTTTSITRLYTTPLAWTAGYDNRNRLTSLVRSGAETSYSYDPNSNRLAAIVKVTSDTDLDGIFDQDDFSQTTAQTLRLDAASNKLLGFTQTVTKAFAGTTRSTVTTPVTYSLDANGALTSDGLHTFEYDASRRLSKVKTFKDGEAARISYLHNALGQRVFKSEPEADQTLPNQTTLSPGFIDWLTKNFQWMYAAAQANTSVGTAYVYDEDANLLGEYDNGSATAKGRQEYIWLPTDSGQAIPIGLYKNGRFFAAHADHLGTPRLITDDRNSPVWQWPYSAFGNNPPSGVLKATPNPKAAITNQPVLLKATWPAIELNLRFPGQYFDEESNLNYNYFRSYQAGMGRYSQPDPIGLEGGVNRFGYVGGNPQSLNDPTGLDSTCTWVGGVLVCQSVPPPAGDPADRRQAPNPLPDLTKPSPYLPSWNWDGITWPNWMESRGKSDPVVLPPLNPGRDCDGKCNPCPVGARWFVPKPGHGHENGYWHEIRYNQDQKTCMCYPDRPSRGLEGM